MSEEEESRSVLGPAGNKTRSVKQSATKPQRKPAVLVAGKLAKEKVVEDNLNRSSNDKFSSNKSASLVVRVPPSAINVSFLSDVSSESSSSKGSSRLSSSSSVRLRRKNLDCRPSRKSDSPQTQQPQQQPVLQSDDSNFKKRCAWVTPNSDPCYIAFHDEEWGVPVHDDRSLFEFLSLSGALAELTWPAILNKRHIFRDIFLDFDPTAVSKLNERKFAAQGSPASSLLSELRLRGILENARQFCKIKEEFGSFDNYIWNFVNHKPVVSQFRYPRQVPAKTSKAEFISKDLVRRGFRNIGPTVVHTFMQVAGLTNDHLISCFRFQECSGIPETRVKENNDDQNAKIERKMAVELPTATNPAPLALENAMDELNMSTM